MKPMKPNVLGRAIAQNQAAAMVDEVSVLRARVAELEGTIQRMTETAAENSRVHVEMHNRNTDLTEALEALNEENSQLAHRLWCIENPE